MDEKKSKPSSPLPLNGKEVVIKNDENLRHAKNLLDMYVEAYGTPIRLSILVYEHKV